MSQSIEVQAAQAGVLRYRRLLTLACVMAIITLTATIAALSVRWFAHVRTYYATPSDIYGTERDIGDNRYIVNRTLSFWDLSRVSVTVQYGEYSLTNSAFYTPFSQTYNIVKVAQGFDLISLLLNAFLLTFLLPHFSYKLRMKINLYLGPIISRLVPSIATFAMGGCLLIAALAFVGINEALDNDGSLCECFDSFARSVKIPLGARNYPNPKTGTIDMYELTKYNDWGPQAGWFLTLLQIPFVFVLLYCVTFNRAPMPIDHVVLADPL